MTLLSFRAIVLGVVMAMLSACHTMPFINRHRMELPHGRPQVTPVTQTQADLRHLPEPAGPITAAVYAFRDLTGQYKPYPDSLYSTSVTQGAASILVESLLESRWFIPVEREGLQDLLTERRIIRAESSKPASPNEKDLAEHPLTAASIIFEGGIVGYESNVRTGGSGANYFGAGASEQYTTDQVTVNLRAINTQTGRILASVTTSKTIYSQATDASMFRYIEFKRLLQVEAGYTRNEPVQLCVREAMQSALIHLIVQGVHDRLWNLKNPKDYTTPMFQAYLQEREAP
ncbi:MAG: curli production assembly/transport protein CsgG [Pseudomonadales bacterium]|nr:curli production assembly/transport protein CsgG [Pseudomonadales bacterium]